LFAEVLNFAGECGDRVSSNGFLLNRFVLVVDEALVLTLDVLVDPGDALAFLYSHAELVLGLFELGCLFVLMPNEISLLLFKVLIQTALLDAIVLELFVALL
jgi:hypothetical protein